MLKTAGKPAAIQGYKYLTLNPACGTLSLSEEESTHCQDLSHRINTLTIAPLLLYAIERRG